MRGKCDAALAAYLNFSSMLISGRTIIRRETRIR